MDPGIVRNSRHNRSGDRRHNADRVAHGAALVSGDSLLIAETSRGHSGSAHSCPQSGGYRSACNYCGDGEDLLARQCATRKYRSGLGCRSGCRRRRRLGRARTRSTSFQFGGLARLGDHQRTRVAGDYDVVVHASDFISRGLVLGSDRDLGSVCRHAVGRAMAAVPRTTLTPSLSYRIAE